MSIILCVLLTVIFVLDANILENDKMNQPELSCFMTEHIFQIISWVGAYFPNY